MTQGETQVSGRHGRASAPAERPARRPFVGRKGDLEQLESGLADALSGAGRVFLIAGEPGIGKTRTTEELLGVAREKGAWTLVGRSVEGEGAPAYWPWLQILRSLTREQTADELSANIGSGAADIAQILPELTEGLSDVGQVASTDLEAARFRLFEAISGFLRQTSRRRPIVLVLEDLHWADPSSLLLLQFLVREVAEAPILVIGTYRDIEVEHGQMLATVLATLRRETVVERILLRGLPESDIGALLAALGGQGVDAAFVHAIFRETEGNPFFIQETLRHLIDERIIFHDGSRWTSKLSPGEMPLPESVREVIGRRIARLGGGARQFLSAAAVIGREFELRIIERVSGLADESLFAALDETLAARVIDEIPAMVGRYTFSHALVREALYSGLRTTERLRLHQRVAESLEAVYGQHADTHASALAYHYFESAQLGNVAKAVHYTVAAGQQAARQVAHGEAVVQYDRALQLLDLAKPSDEKRRCQVLVAFGSASWAAGEFQRSKEANQKAAAIAQHLGLPAELAEAALGFAGDDLAFAAGEVDETVVGLLTSALASVEEGDNVLRARLMGRLAAALAFSDDARRDVLADGAVEMARRIGDRGALLKCLRSRAWATAGPDTVEACLRDTEESFQIESEIGGVGGRWGFWQPLQLGDIEAVDRNFEETVRLSAKSRSAYDLWTNASFRATRALLEGRLEEVEELAAKALSLGQEAQNQNAAHTFAAQMGFLRREQGRLEEWVGPIEAAVLHAPRETAVTLLYRCALVWLLANLGSTDDARRHFEALAANDFTDLPRDVFWIARMWFLSEAAGELRDAPRAESLYEMLAPYESRCMTMDTACCGGSVARPLGRLAATCGRFEAAERHFQTALEVNERIRSAPWVAWTEFDYARMLFARGAEDDEENGSIRLGRAFDTARRLGMKALEDRCLAVERERHKTPTDATSSIDAVVDSLTTRRPDLRSAAAPDGTVTILFSDMEGFTAMTERLGDLRAREVIRDHNRIVREELRAHGGYEVELQGDGFLLAFGSARKGLLCAIGIQKRFAEYNESHREEPIRVRIGVNSGEALVEGEKFFGKTVILAARIAAQGKGAEILVSSLVKGLTESVGEFAFDGGREAELKGIAGRQRIHHVLWCEGSGEEVVTAESPPRAFHEAVFRHEGDSWSIAYDGRVFRLKDLKGLGFIAELLRHPGQEMHVLDLASELGRARTSESSAERARISVTVNVKEAIKRIAKLDAELGRYLGTTIKTGNFCSYSPDPRWGLRWSL
jgi:class 3 adenylate cyclase